MLAALAAKPLEVYTTRPDTLYGASFCALSPNHPLSAELAREKSTGPSGPNGGELGWFSAGMMVEPFQDAVETLEVGAVSEPVQTQFGWHVIKLNESRAKEAPALDEVRGEIEMSLQQQAVEKYIDETLASAEVTRMDKSEADVSALSNMQLLED